MPEGPNFVSQEQAEAFDRIMKADSWANINYPQMFGPKMLKTGESFLTGLLKGSMSYSDFTRFEPYGNSLSFYTTVTNNVHEHYGRSRDYKLNEEGFLRVFNSTKTRVEFALEGLFNTKDLGVFFRDKNEIPKIKAAKQLHSSAVKSLSSFIMTRLSRSYCNTYEIVFEKRLVNLNRSELERLNKAWTFFSQKVKSVIKGSVLHENRGLDKSVRFADDRLEEFLKHVAFDGSEIEKHRDVKSMILVKKFFG